MSRTIQWLVACAALTHLLTANAHGGTITFGSGGSVILPGNPQTEGDFTYDAFSGSLVTALARGNPPGDLEGNGGSEGGTAVFTRSDGGLFTFDQVDVGMFNYQIARFVVFEGRRDGSFLGFDSLQSGATSDVFVTRTSSTLSGVLLDELRVQLEASSTLFAWEMIDNLVLTPSPVTPVPEPSTFALITIGGLALVGYGWRRRRLPA